MKLLQANVWGGRLSNQLSDFLIEQQADIACLQETVSTKGDALIFETIEAMQATVGYKHVFFSPVFDFNLMQKNCRLRQHHF